MAVEYDNETIDFWERFPATFVSKFRESVKPKGKILDVGSGPGRDGLILQKEGFDMTCLDASEAMIKMCEDRGLKGIVGDFLKLPFSDEEFDAVWAYTSLLHIEKSKIKEALSEIKRVLKLNGIFALGMIEGEKEEYRASSGVDKPRYFAFYKKQELENLLKEFGFEIIYFEEFKPGSKNYLNFISKKI